MVSPETLDDLTLVVGGRQLSGWTSVRLTRSVERVPSTFELSLTERYPGEADALLVQPGDGCTVLLGADLVLTGYVDRFVPSIDGRSHSIMVMGRSRVCDLVDCSAVWPGGQISGASALAVAQRLAQPYGITVTSTAPPGRTIPQFNLMLGETCYEVIERICRYSQLLAYDLPDGNLVLAQTGTMSAASGFQQGINVQRASAAYSMDEKYSKYVVVLQALDVLGDAGDGGNQAAVYIDPTVSRFRELILVSDQADGGQLIAGARARWEAARRYGRSMRVTLETDSWRDADGVLYAPNTLVPLDLPVLKTTPGELWVVSEVSYRRDEGGTAAELVLMPPEAFQPQPTLLLPFMMMDVLAGSGQ